MPDEDIQGPAGQDPIDGYPPDEDFGDPAVSGPGTVPQPRAAAVRAAARAAGGMARPTQKAKPAKKVKRGSGSKLLAQQRRRQALELRKAGASYQQIAESLGYHDASGARKAVVKAFGEVIHEPVGELRTMQVERLNHMLMTLWPRVQQGDDSAIRTSLAVMDKMDRLQGTEQAAQVDVNVTQQAGILVIDGNKDDFIGQMKKMAGIDPNGNNITGPQQAPQAQGGDLPALPPSSGHQYPPGMIPAGHDHEDIVEGELVDEPVVAPEPVRDEHPADPVRTGEAAHPTKKKFSFGVDPTVRRDK